MKNRNLKYKAEDWLTNEHLVEEVRSDASAQASDGQLKLAVWFHRALLKGKQVFSTSDKQQLGDRIQNSIDNYKRRIFVLRFSAAASLAILSGGSYLYLTSQDDAIAQFGNLAMDIPTDGKTQLYLSGEQAIAISSDESEIDYSSTGHIIEIDASEKVIQQVEDGDLVFNTVVVPYGKRSKIKLSDNTSVWLNSGSKLVFPAAFENSKREVYLKGEAYFEVNHDEEHPFHVHTDNMEVQVLGTSFNVSAYDDEEETNTVLVEGAVELNFQGTSLLGKASRQMEPGTIARYSNANKTLDQAVVDTRLYTSWRDGYLIFNQQPLSDILKKVSRYYNITIQLEDPNLAQETFSGNLDLQNSALQLLQIVGEIIHARIEQQDDQIIITRI